jgi:hypothetical protein
MKVTKDILHDLYVVHKMSVRQCAEVLGMPTHGPISWYLKKFNIKSRPGRFYAGMEQAWERKPERHGSWKGGKSSISCDHCGKKMMRFPSLIREKNFCGWSCKREFIPENMVGKKFGLLTVVRRAGKDGHYGRTQWECSCECGGKKIVSTGSLRNTMSCGCLLRRTGDANPTWQGGKHEVKCANPRCNNTKMVYPSHQKLYSEIYCSQKCMGRHISESERRKGTNSPRYKERLNVACAYCGNSITVTQWRKATYKNHFCTGTDCLAKWQAEHQIGPQNGNWRGGLSFEPYPVTWNFRLREMIRERDGRTCQVCGIAENGTRLAVHHVDYDKANLAPLNLVSLCHQCHVKTNGRREEWIKFFSAGANVATA